MAGPELRRAYRAFRAWMFNEALPFWAATARDAPGLGFVEHLTLQGLPDPVAFKRLRLQARQIYVFSHAEILGWTGGSEIARAGFEFICRHGWREAGGWARRLGREGGVEDATADLYDTAVVLFGLAWYARAAADPAAVDWANRTLRWVRHAMAATHGGFWNTVPPGTDPRQQNPHMHLLEGALALHDVTADDQALDLARELVGLFRRHWFNAATGTLGEFFGQDWSAAPGEVGAHVEPGHHYEWVWLLREYQGRTGEDLATERGALYRFANAHGVDPATGLVLDAVTRDGVARSCSSRLWPQTEALRAHLVIGGAEAEAHAAHVIDTMLGRYFAWSPRGTWMDQFGPDGAPIADKIPASSLYHVFGAYAELDRAMRGHGAAPFRP